MQKELYRTKGKHANKITVNLIGNGLKKFKDNIDNIMSKDETEIEKPNERVKSVEKILGFNNQNQEGQELKT